MASKPANEHYEIEPLSNWLISLLCMGMVITLVGMVSTVFELRLFDAIEQGSFASEEEMNEAAISNDHRVMALGFLELAWFVIAGVLSLVWIHHSAHNAAVHAQRMEYSPAACVWWYFIPIAMLWKPYSAMKEIWSETASQAGQPANSNAGLLGVWWFFWIIMNMVYNASVRISWRAEELQEFRLADHILLVGSALDIAATLAFLLMIQRLGALQDQVRANPPAPAPVGALPGANW